jgi:hypothetical protein
MELVNTSQYNQSIGKLKLLSSTAGVGSIITSKIGYYILVSDINKWEFVKKAHSLIEEIRVEETDNSKRYEKAQIRFTKNGITLIDDKRFIDFIKTEKELPELVCLITIPNIALNEHFNFPNWRDHPINKLFEGSAKADDYMVKGTHFPKWFINDKGDLKHYNDWKRMWVKKNLGLDKFVPPRDANKPLKDSDGNPRKIVINSEGQGTITYPLFATLSQTNLILICPNGHLSDLPWPQYLKWRAEKKEKTDVGQDLFTSDQCCPTPDLKWTESKTKSEGYGSVYIQCNSCGTGNGSNGQKINLEGINNLKPCCPGHKPWEIDLTGDRTTIPDENCFKRGQESFGREQMQVALVTGNNVYYANGFTSLYIPQYLAENRSAELIAAIVKIKEKYEKYLKARPGISKKDFWDKLDKEDFLIENGFNLENLSNLTKQIEDEFLELTPTEEVLDIHERYRWQEYHCFSEHSELTIEGLRFNDIVLPVELRKYFTKIQQMEEIKLTQVQLDFTRVKPKERIKINDEIRTSSQGQNIFSVDEKNLFVLPANELYGEGIFFQFNEQEINNWYSANKAELDQRFHKFFREVDLNSQGAAIKQRIKNNNIQHFVIHSFSHLLMRELEFACGYPTASLKERLYISDRMCGVLVYTSEGSEGSMGGLVWQGQADKIKDLIIKGLERSTDCSSDPICWESEGQGVFDLNLSACFSCALVSETACEEMNLGLDRRSLVDSGFGFFSNLLGY